MSEYIDLELIDKYIDGSLNSEEKAFFENRLKLDQEFNLLYKDSLAINEIIFHNEVDELINELNKHLDSESGGFENLLKIGAVIGFVALVSIGLFFYYSHINKTNESEQVANIQIEESKTDKEIVEKIESQNIPFEEKLNIIKSKVLKPSFKTKVEAIDVIQTDIAQIGLANIINQNVTVSEITTKPTAENINKLNIETSVNAKHNCAESISEKITILASCDKEHTGLIEVSQIKGGKAPYIIQLNNGHFAVDHAKFISLQSGDYSITISDENKCKKVIKDIIVTKKHCVEPENQHHIKVNNDYLVSLQDSKWQIPNCPEKAYLEIRSKDGEHIYSAEIKKDVNDVWHLQNLHGHVVNLGVYLYSLKNVDTNEYVIGSITVVE